MAASLQHEDFASQLNINFRVQVDDANTVDLVLAEVSELKTSLARSNSQLFFVDRSRCFWGRACANSSTTKWATSLSFSFRSNRMTMASITNRFSID